ncbi:MAG: hypothetical protein JRI66_13485 [Deltaproteobacteria bacterium]|nr:hypothetical protein [Deltaproteobacteria bacterium]
MLRVVFGAGFKKQGHFLMAQRVNFLLLLAGRTDTGENLENRIGADQFLVQGLIKRPADDVPHQAHRSPREPLLQKVYKQMADFTPFYFVNRNLS